jgi:hypothetical protein
LNGATAAAFEFSGSSKGSHTLLYARSDKV